MPFQDPERFESLDLKSKEIAEVEEIASKVL